MARSRCDGLIVVSPLAKSDQMRSESRIIIYFKADLQATCLQPSALCTLAHAYFYEPGLVLHNIHMPRSKLEDGRAGVLLGNGRLKVPEVRAWSRHEHLREAILSP